MEMIICPGCGAGIPVGSAYCDVCGTPMTPSPKEREMFNIEGVNCPQCGKENSPGTAYCGNCGARLAAIHPESAEPVPGFCPNCNAAVQAADLYCDNCGHALRPDPDGLQPSPQSAEALSILPDQAAESSNPVARPGPSLIIQPGEIVLDLMPDQDTYIIGREDPGSGSYPDVDLVPFGGEEGGVSRRHARITRNGELFFIEDLNSVNYTFVNRKKIAVGVAHPLQNGDEIRLGRVLMRFETS